MTCSACHKTRAAIFSAMAGGSGTLAMTEDYTYVAAGGIHIQYLAGETYRNVPHVVATQIVAAQAGTIADTHA